MSAGTRIRTEVYEEQDGLCDFCGRPLDDVGWHVDRINPAGRYTPANRRGLCVPCHRERHHQLREQGRTAAT